MGIFSKNKGKSYSFDYSIQVHSLRPWPATGGPLFISWQRGSAKRGNTAPVNPTTTPGVPSAEYRFEDRLSISATLYSEGYKGKDDTSIGPFTDKWLILSIMGAGRGKGKEQGQVVVNLAHYAAVHNEARQGFTVAVSDKKISQSHGEIVLEVTIGCQIRNKKKGKFTMTGTSNASSSGLQRTGSEISDSEYGSEYGDDAHGGGAGAIMESIREEDYSPGSAKAQRHAEASRFGPGPLESVPEPVPEQSVSPRQSDFGSRMPPAPEAGPVRPLAAQGNAGKAAKYDEDGFLLDDEEDEPQAPVAARASSPTRPIVTPAKPPSEYDLAYDSSPAPSPRANQLLRNQDEAPSNVGLSSRQAQPTQQSTAESGQKDLASQISRLAEEESDEDDFLAAAVAAVEAQDKGQPMPSPAQRAQQGRPAGLTAPSEQRQQPIQQRPAANEAFLPSDDDMSPQAVQMQQSRPSMPAIPPSVPRTWQRPSPQPQRQPQDVEDTPQRSEQSLRSRYGGQKPAAGSDASGGAAAAFLAARTGSGTAPAVPQGQPQALSSRPLLSGAAQPSSPGPVPIARPPTSAYKPPQPAAAATAAAADAKPSSKWFRKTPPVAPPPQVQAPPQPKAADAPYNPFDSPTSQNGDARMSPMAIANQQQQQQQKPQQEAGMFMDESDEEEDQAFGRPGTQRGSVSGQGSAQQPQMNKVSPRGAISAGVGGTGAEGASVGPGSPAYLQQNGQESPAYSDQSLPNSDRSFSRSPSQVERIRANLEAQAQSGGGLGPTHRPVIGTSYQTSPTINRGAPDRDFARQDNGQQVNGDSGSSIRTWARKLDSTRDPLAAVRKAEEEEKQLAQQRAQEEDQARLRAQEEEQARIRAQEAEQARIRAEEEQLARRRAEEQQQARIRAEEEQQAWRRAEEEQQARRRAEEEQQARRRAEEEQQSRRRAEQEQQARRRAEEEQQLAQRRAAEEERVRREAEAEEQLRLEAEEDAKRERQETEAAERRRRRAEEEEAEWLRHDEEQKAAAAAASAFQIAESAKVMATPTGLRQSSRDLGFPPQQQGQEQSQEGMSDLPPGFTYARLESMVRELRTAAALEASVYLARSGKGNARRVKARSVHAPARRLARTTISLGPDEGIAFGLRAVRAIEAAADGSSDVIGMAYWWSNCIQLRWMLWAMCHGGDQSEDGSMAEEAQGMDEFDWVMKVLVPPLRELESYIFERLFRYLWQKALLESVSREPTRGPAMFSPHQMTPIHKASQHEDAIQRWLDALQDTHRTLMPAKQSATNGHVTLLKQKMVTAILRRLDCVLFDKLTAGDTGGGMSPDSRDVFSSGWKQSGHNRTASSSSMAGGAPTEPPLDPKLLPFSKGPLSFGVGVNLKMAVSRWTDWAHDAGVREEKGVLEGYSFFPQLRATADLLMMPKEVLTDRSIRAEILPGLSLRRICTLLERFQPDDFSADPLPRGLLSSLQNETPPSEVSPSPVGRLEAGYEPPTERQLLDDGLIEPVNLEMDAESDDELDALSEMYDPDNKGEGTQRYTLLRELWSSAR